MSNPSFEKPPVNVLAVISLVSALFFVFGIVAVWAGQKALKQIKISHERGAQIARVGFALGFIQIVATVIVFASVMIMMVSF
jgi:hypothetical protein